jgi:phosphoribosylamine--glycine ligase
MIPPVAPTRILIVGGGGREHALAWKLAAEPGVNRVVVAPGSDAIADEPRVTCAPGVDQLDGAALVEIALREVVELAVIGPEAPLAAGVADALRGAGVPTFGPSRAAARIETSKAFCREIAAAAGVRMARGSAFDSIEPAAAFVRDLARSGGIVVKADGLAAGKGVTVCGDAGEALAALEAVLADHGGTADGGAPAGRPRVVVEERLEGREASVIALCDGRDAVALPVARDHKRLLDGDAGPNTGGMGAYSPLPDLTDADVEHILETIHRPILAELARRDTPFVGALYAGLMLTAAGPALLECNARFGDPETQVILPRLAGALGPWLLAATRGALVGDGLTAARLAFVPGAAVGIVLAAAGYPSAPRRGDPVSGLDEVRRRGLVFVSGLVRDADGIERTAGGRVCTVVGRGRDLASARAAAETLADRVGFEGLQRRRDIGVDGPSGGRVKAVGSGSVVAGSTVATAGAHG